MTFKLLYLVLSLITQIKIVQISIYMRQHFQKRSFPIYNKIGAPYLEKIYLYHFLYTILKAVLLKTNFGGDPTFFI